MKWIKNKSRCGHIVLWLLNNRIFFFYQPFHWGYEFELRFYITKRHEVAFYGYGDFNLKRPFEAAFKFKRTRAKLSVALFGWEISFRVGEVVCDEYDAHRDIYFPYGELVDGDWQAYQDEEMTIPENYVKPQPEEYKDFYISKFLKIYNKDYRNCRFGRIIEFALPFQHYLKIDFQKPFEYWEWLGFIVDIDFTQGFGIFTKLMLCKLDFILRLGKDCLERTSNLRSVAAIERYDETQEGDDE